MMDSIAVPVPELLEQWLCWAEWVKTPCSQAQPSGLAEAACHFERLVKASPEEAWQAIVLSFADRRFEAHHDLLAAGPLEELLSLHGERFIDRVEAQAAQDVRFAFALSGIWGLTMPEAIFCRVQGIWERRGWKDLGSWRF